MLEGLDAVNWSDLAHAYGSAADVPAQLRALLSSDPDTRMRALWACYGTIVHQGYRYEAAVPAVPFLLEIVAGGPAETRKELLELLLTLAVGYDEAWLPEGFSRARARPVELACYDAVAAGIPLFTGLLRDDDPAVRRTAAALLGWFPASSVGGFPASSVGGFPASSVPALTALITDPDPEVAATAVLALGLLGAGGPVTAAFGSADPTVRGAAAIALARLHRAAAPAAVTDELLRWSSGSAGPLRTKIPYYEGDLSGYATLALRQVLPDDSEAAFEALLGRLPTVSGLAALPVVGEALRRAFLAGPIAPDTPYASLTPRQQRLVRTLADSPATWQVEGSTFASLCLMIAEYHLPSTHQAMDAYARLF
ncbi:HEAT repeat domain-containing protein [Actinoplanes sp. LDG1-06]|uniref:HEAT repeat domain-containing protein n=1 Tax=Paractinoplanes ovalisporus TaxID=2810368 RepID=A0ABS2A831_9ACTN|nr:HEAT repeat domain-containing protein [Actinoplanes ovalisporus]MBM2615991.1 HEAT repeat domain-containing protein [Actinoplanes ovalisporus]